MEHVVRCLCNDADVVVTVAPALTVLEWLRESQRLTGTKEGCREGDCGACCVLLGRREGAAVQYQLVNSCLLPMAAVDGAHLVTIEGLNRAALSPLQAAMVDEGGTQCGFCTPGFIVAITHYLLSHSDYRVDDAVAALDGNICRCTGYHGIRRAIGTVIERIEEITADSSLDRLIRAELLPEYFRTIPARLAEIPPEIPPDPPLLKGGNRSLPTSSPFPHAGGNRSLVTSSPLLHEGGNRSWVATASHVHEGDNRSWARSSPCLHAEANRSGATLTTSAVVGTNPPPLTKGGRGGFPACARRLIAGGTDLMVREWDTLATADVDLVASGASGDGIHLDGETIVVDSTATMADCAASPVLRQHLPTLCESLRWFGSAPIRARATVAGNIVNASPIADMTSMLLALDAQLTIQTFSLRVPPLCKCEGDVAHDQLPPACRSDEDVAHDRLPPACKCEPVATHERLPPFNKGGLGGISGGISGAPTTQETVNLRSIPLRAFYRGYKQCDLREGEWIAAITVPIPNARSRFHFEKVSRRPHLDIASVNSSCWLELDGDTIVTARLSAGGVAPTPLFLVATCDAIVGRTVNAETVRAAADAAASEIAPISDARGSAAYKTLLLRRLIAAHFLALCPTLVREEDLL